MQLILLLKSNKPSDWCHPAQQTNCW